MGTGVIEGRHGQTARGGTACREGASFVLDFGSLSSMLERSGNPALAGKGIIKYIS
jgi:hypothetical protein